LTADNLLSVCVNGLRIPRDRSIVAGLWSRKYLEYEADDDFKYTNC
jgi:hypothetical protein